MKLSECKHGVILEFVNDSFGGSHRGKLAMVVGISENSQGEAIPLVQFQNGEVYPCHHANFILYEEE